MKASIFLTIDKIALALQTAAQVNNVKICSVFKGYTNSRAPLHKNPYLELPLGDIKPQGWLREMLVRQKTGATGNLDKLYPVVMNNRTAG